MLVLFLNELSSDSETLELDEARGRVLALLRVLRQVRHQQRKVGLNSQVSLKDTLVDKRYTLFELLSGNDYRDEWRFLRGFVNRSPLSDGIKQGFDLNTQEVEYLYEGRRVFALGWADIMDSAVVSFPGSLFQQPSIELTRIELDEHLEVHEQNVSVRNIADIDHVTHHAQWLRDFVFTVSVAQLWQYREEFFPYVRFLPRVESDLKQLSGTYPQIVRRLPIVFGILVAWRFSSPFIGNWLIIQWRTTLFYGC